MTLLGCESAVCESQSVTKIISELHTAFHEFEKQDRKSFNFLGRGGDPTVL